MTWGERLSVGLALVTSLAALMVAADEVALTTAKDAALAWRERQGALGSSLGRRVRDARTVMPLAGRSLHVVRFEERGFVVLSADDAEEPVVAFSSDQDLVESEANPLWALLKRDAELRRGKRREDARRRWLSLLAPAAKQYANGRDELDDVRVRPLVASAWDQGDVKSGHFYNYYTPNYSPCGCVATAAAQIMRYFEWPRSAMPVYTNRYCFINGRETELVTQGGVYDWAKMTLRPVAQSIAKANRQAVGKLTSDIGIAVGMEYTVSSSGAYTFNLPEVFVERFGYANAVCRLCDDTAGEESIEENSLRNALLSNFDAGLPVVLSIFGTHTGGHAIVGDGYGYQGGTLYVHCNLGWGGTSDAWYAPPLIDDGTVCFNVFDGVVYNIFTNQTAGASIVSGRVVGHDLRPLSGVRVRASGAAGSGETLTGENGIYALVLPPGDYELTADRDELTAVRQVTLKRSVSVAMLTGRDAYKRFYGFYSDTPPSSVGNLAGIDMVLSAAAMPVIDDYSPRAAVQTVGCGDTLDFSLSAHVAGGGLSYAWYLDEVQVATGGEYRFTAAYSQRGSHRLVCRLSTPDWPDAVEQTWTLEVRGVVWADAVHGDDALGTGERERPFASLAKALAATFPGEQVRVLPGVYSRFTAPEHPVSVTAVDGPETTVVDGEAAGSCCQGHIDGSGEDESDYFTFVSGFTLTNGAAEYGGGANSCVLSNCILRASLAANGGGAYDCFLYRCVITGNRASEYSGGAGAVCLVHCTVYGNVCDVEDGGAGVDFDSLVCDSIVWDNYDANGKLDNFETYAYWDWYYGYVTASTIFLGSCTYPTGFEDYGVNITNDPRFVDLKTDDWRLRALSPCLGAASDSLNMGVWEGPGVVVGKTLHVDRLAGDDAADGLGWATAKRSIAAAVAAAASGDQILVKPGVYDPVTVPDEIARLTITATDGPQVTVIDANGAAGCCVANPGTVISGFTFRNGMSSGSGGGVSGAHVIGSVISNCCAATGGGAARALVENSLLFANVAKNSGGGAYECELLGCTLVGNRAGTVGDGAYLYKAAKAVNSIFALNGDAGASASRQVRLAGAAALDHCLVLGADSSAGFVDPAHGDFRLAASSPAVDAGVLAAAGGGQDLLGHARVFGPRPDIGCYEYDLVAPGWPEPLVEPGADAAAEAAGVAATMSAAGFAPAVASRLETAVQYDRLNAWAIRNGVTLSAAVASPAPLASAALDLASPIGADGGGFAFGWLRLEPAATRLDLRVTGADTAKIDLELMALAFEVWGGDCVEGGMAPLKSRPEIDAEGAALVVEGVHDERRFFWKGVMY